MDVQGCFLSTTLQIWCYCGHVIKYRTMGHLNFDCQLNLSKSHKGLVIISCVVSASGKKVCLAPPCEIGLNTPLTPVNNDALRILQANMQARDNEILQMLGNLDFRIGQAERDAEIAVAATTHQSPTTLGSPPILQHGPRQLSNAGSNANSRTSSPNEAQRAVIALNNKSPPIFNQSPAASSVTTPNADSTDDAYGEANSIQTSPDSNESILSPDDDHGRDPTYDPNNGIHSPIINH